MKTLGQRLKYLRKLKKYTQVTLGKAIGVTGVTVGYWEKDLNEPGGKALSKLARALNTTENYLLYGKNPGSVIPIKNSNIRFIPLLTWEEAISFTKNRGYEMPNQEKVIPDFVNASPKAFCIRIDDDTMVNPYGEPSIPKGAIITIDPLDKPTNGKIVAAIISDNLSHPPRNIMMAKKLVIHGLNSYLMPLNPRYDKILITDSCEIIGTVRGIHFEL
ncbi:MAG: LexA family protein [Candidatus Arsenophonus phytopathogenicus]